MLQSSLIERASVQENQALEHNPTILEKVPISQAEAAT